MRWMWLGGAWLFALASLVEAEAESEAENKCSANNTNSTCKDGLLIPSWKPREGLGTGDIVCRALVYLLGLFYLFLGTSIVADRFMAAIEVITSKEKEIKVRRVTGEEYTILVRVWNETVSNLTLMALGSSAPEILLSVIEICGNKFEAGDLGPGTIVGSAAFNLFVIIAICIGVVPSSEVRRIKHIGVFWVTAIWSIFAYVWLYLILAQISPGRVTLLEGLITFAFFPLTVLTAWLADRRLFGLFEHRYFGVGGKGPSRPTSVRYGGTPVTNGDVEVAIRSGGDGGGGGAMSEEERLFEEHRGQYIQIFKELRGRHPEAPIQLLETMAEEELLRKGPKSRAFYRINATRQLVGAGNVVNKRIHEIEAEKKRIKAKVAAETEVVEEEETMPGVVFAPGHYTCMEDVGTLYATVACRRGKLQPPCVVQVDYKTEDGTAEAPSDYVSVEGTLTFYPNEERKNIGVEIVDNDIYEEDETFSIILSNVRAFPVDAAGKPNHGAAPLPSRLLTPNVATVMIVDNDHCGAFGFSQESCEVSEAAEEIHLSVTRTRGARGQVRLPYQTVDGSAQAGHDYVHKEGVLHFDDEQAEASITIEIINDDTYEKSETFTVVLGEPEWDSTGKEGEIAQLGRPILAEIPRCKVTIKESKEFKGFVDKMLAKTNANVVVGTSSWREQFKEALAVSGSEEEGEDSAGCVDYVMHGLTLPWKLAFALIPPTDYAGGWLCFVFSIAAIGFMTALIGDFASAFGCTVGLKDAVTAISLVALGTSLPDTFASKTAALGDTHADSSIINVTGSNAVNVFLGIGVAWAIAAIYHTARGSVFEVEAGSLAFSVTLFCVGAVIAVLLLHLRRKLGPKAELGGALSFKIVTVTLFIGLWLCYVTLSTLEAYCVIPGF